jgi:hypothetical protein
LTSRHLIRRTMTCSWGDAAGSSSFGMLDQECAYAGGVEFRHSRAAPAPAATSRAGLFRTENERALSTVPRARAAHLGQTSRACGTDCHSDGYAAARYL